MFGVILQIAQGYQDAGVTMASFYNIGGQTGFNCWDAYETGNQQRGTGNPITDAINLTNPLAKNQVFGEVPGGWNHWATLVAPTPTPSNPVVKPRNGRMRTIGLYRGTHRTTRSR